MTDLKCVVCDKYFQKLPDKQKKVLTDPSDLFKARKLAKKDSIKSGDQVCNYCRKKMYKIDVDQDSILNVVIADQAVAESSQASSLDFFSQSTTTSTDSSTLDPSFQAPIISVEEQGQEYVEMPFHRVVSTHKYCFICGYSKRSNLVTVPLEARIQTFSKKRIVIPAKNVCCEDHLIKKRFYSNELDHFRIYSNTSNLSVDDIRKLMTTMAESADRSLMAQLGDFNLSEERLHAFTSLSWEEFSELRSMLTSMRNSDVRSVTQALIVFLFKLRTGNSNNIISSILGLEYSQQLSNIKKSVIKSFENDILLKHFGLENNVRDNLIQNHTSTMARKLHGNEKLILICDGTYIRHQKSTNNEYQRKSFSGQKKVPLCKPFTICTTDGYIVDMIGPFLANINDANILMEILESSPSLRNLLNEQDIMILDRGFRDVVTLLEDMGLNVLMPALKGKRNQLTAKESNNSRFVTKLRWVVEAVHGIIKQKFKLLDHKLDNKMLPEIGTYVRIACFIHNKFGKSLDSDLGISDEILISMNSRQQEENTLATEAESRHWGRRKVIFKDMISTDLLDFPELTTHDLIVLFTGTYQLKQTVSYLAEMIDEEDRLKIGYHKEFDNLIKVLVHSRHRSAKTYKCFIEYKSQGTGYKSILRYCCDCPNGNRTVGCCSHVAAVIYYLSNARFQDKIIRPAEILSKMFVKDGLTVCVNEDSDDDE